MEALCVFVTPSRIREAFVAMRAIVRRFAGTSEMQSVFTI